MCLDLEIIKMYQDVTVRDDFVLKIVSTLKEADDVKENYIIIPRAGILTIIINNYKKSKKYGQIKVPLTKEMSTSIRTYIAGNNITEYLFGKSKLSQFVSKNNKKMGIDTGINAYRHMKVADELSKQLSAEDKVKLASSMKHTPIIQARYLDNINK